MPPQGYASSRAGHADAFGFSTDAAFDVASRWLAVGCVAVGDECPRTVWLIGQLGHIRGLIMPNMPCSGDGPNPASKLASGVRFLDPAQFTDVFQLHTVDWWVMGAVSYGAVG